MINKAFSSEDINIMKRTLFYIKPYSIKLFVICICLILNIVLGLIEPLIWARILSSLFKANYQGIVIEIKYLCLLSLFKLIIFLYRQYLFGQVHHNMILDLRSEMYRKILNLPSKIFDKMRTGDFLSRLHDDVSIISNIICNDLLKAIIDIMKVIIIGVAVFRINIILSFIVVISFIISYNVFIIFGKKFRKIESELKLIVDTYFSTISQSISGIKEIKGLGIKEINKKIVFNIFKKLRDKCINLHIKKSYAQTFSMLNKTSTNIIIYLLGGYFVYKKALSIEYFIVFTSYSSQFSFSLENIVNVNSNIHQSLASLERIFTLLDNFSYDSESFGNKNIENIDGNVSFRDITFSYTKEQIILNRVSFDIKKGQKIAIVGRSGSGKTTILNLLQKLYTPQHGNIYIDGIDINEFNEKSLRKHISIVSQEPYLFNASIIDNLRFVDKDADLQDIIAACKKAHIHNHIIKLKNQYNTIISENGTNFSVGQKQRIALARALLKNSSIILLDEVTSALDNESQNFINNSIDMLSGKHTIIVIAHRMSTIMNSDKIIVIDAGKIVACGKHGTLFNNSDIYRKLLEE